MLFIVSILISCAFANDFFVDADDPTEIIKSCDGNEPCYTSVNAAWNNVDNKSNVTIKIIRGISLEEIQIYIENSQSLKIEGNSDSCGMTSQLSGPLFVVINSTLQIKTCSIEQGIGSSQSSSRMITANERSQIQFENVYFICNADHSIGSTYLNIYGGGTSFQNCALTGGRLSPSTSFIIRSASASISDCNIQNMTYSNGAYVLDLQQINESFSISRCSFYNISVPGFTDCGCIRIEVVRNADVLFNSCDFSNCGTGIDDLGLYSRPKVGALMINLGIPSAPTEGEGEFIWPLGAVKLERCQFQECRGSAGGALFVLNNASQIVLSKCDFNRCVGGTANDIYFERELEELVLFEDTLVECRSNSKVPQIFSGKEGQELPLLFNDFYSRVYVDSQTGQQEWGKGGSKTNPLPNIDSAITELRLFEDWNGTIVILDQHIMHLEYNNIGNLYIQPDEDKEFGILSNTEQGSYISIVRKGVLHISKFRIDYTPAAAQQAAFIVEGPIYASGPIPATGRPDLRKYKPSLRLQKCEFGFSSSEQGSVSMGTDRFVNVIEGEAVIENCIFHNAIFTLSGSAVSIDDYTIQDPNYIITSLHNSLYIFESTFENITAGAGSGSVVLIALRKVDQQMYGQYPISRQVQLSSCIFHSCGGQGANGGAVRLVAQDYGTDGFDMSANTKVSITGCLFNNCTASYGGAVYINGYFSNFDVSFCDFSHNVERTSRANDIYFASQQMGDRIIDTDNPMIVGSRSNSNQPTIFINDTIDDYSYILLPYQNITTAFVRVEGGNSSNSTGSSVAPFATITGALASTDSLDVDSVSNPYIIVLSRQTLQDEAQINIRDRIVTIENLPRNLCPIYSRDISLIQSHNQKFSRLFYVHNGRLSISECEFSHTVHIDDGVYSYPGINDALIYVGGNGQVSLSLCRLGLITSGIEGFLYSQGGDVQISHLSCVSTVRIPRSRDEGGGTIQQNATFIFQRAAINCERGVKNIQITNSALVRITSLSGEGGAVFIDANAETFAEIRNSLFLLCSANGSGGGACSVNTHFYSNSLSNEQLDIFFSETQFINCSCARTSLLAAGRGSSSFSSPSSSDNIQQQSVGGAALFVLGDGIALHLDHCLFRDNEVDINATQGSSLYRIRMSLVGHDVHFVEANQESMDPSLIFADCYATHRQAKQRVFFYGQESEDRFGILLAVPFKNIIVSKNVYTDIGSGIEQGLIYDQEQGEMIPVITAAQQLGFISTAPIGTVANPLQSLNEAVEYVDVVSRITTTVMAEHGIYDEEPLVVGKHLQIVGSSPITCYVRATIGTAAPLCTVFESGNVLLRELALIHLQPQSQNSLLFVDGKGASLIVRNCIFRTSGKSQSNTNIISDSDIKSRSQQNRIQSSPYIAAIDGVLEIHSTIFDPIIVKSQITSACVYGRNLRGLTLSGCLFDHTLSALTKELNAVDVSMIQTTAAVAGQVHVPGIVVITDCVFDGRGAGGAEQGNSTYQEDEEVNYGLNQEYDHRIPSCGWESQAVRIEYGLVAVTSTKFIGCAGGALRLRDVLNSSIGDDCVFELNMNIKSVRSDEGDEVDYKPKNGDDIYIKQNKLREPTVGNPIVIQGQVFEGTQRHIFCEGATSIDGQIDGLLVDQKAKTVKQMKQAKSKNNKIPLWIMFDDNCHFTGEFGRKSVIQSPYATPSLGSIQIRKELIERAVQIKNNKDLEGEQTTEQEYIIHNVVVQRLQTLIKGKQLLPCSKLLLELSDKKNASLTRTIDLLQQISRSQQGQIEGMIPQLTKEEKQLRKDAIKEGKQAGDQEADEVIVDSLSALTGVRMLHWITSKRLEIQLDLLLSATVIQSSVENSSSRLIQANKYSNEELEDVLSGNWKGKLIFARTPQRATQTEQQQEQQQNEDEWGLESRTTKNVSLTRWLQGWVVALIIIFVILVVLVIIIIVILIIVYYVRRNKQEREQGFFNELQDDNILQISPESEFHADNQDLNQI
ncbi:MAG: hypothetical protein EZS28_013522 [Streblomastix strix]|uniref:Uncharacterized protein n=1 Tax=Streblomastix strix TaxID=222440 RepID=A0A5J4W7Y4_9EUKA|nr:MAG: hypothetical protein EZS28_013522 [Streblomastix strix]